MIGSQRSEPSHADHRRRGGEAQRRPHQRAARREALANGQIAGVWAARRCRRSFRHSLKWAGRDRRTHPVIAPGLGSQQPRAGVVLGARMPVVALLIVAALMWISPFGAVVALVMAGGILVTAHPTIATTIGVMVVLVVIIAWRERRAGRHF